MARYAVVNKKTGVVENTVEWDGEAEWAPPAGCDVVPIKTAPSPGDKWDGTDFVASAEVGPRADPALSGVTRTITHVSTE